MKTIKLLYSTGFDLFYKEISEDKYKSVIPEEINFLDMFIEMYPEVTKVEILEIIEYVFLLYFNYAYMSEKSESDESMQISLFKYTNISNDFHASYISEYYHIVGHLFLSGYIDFMVDAPEETLLSNYMEDKYKAWLHFRDNFLYKERFNYHGYDVQLYNGKIYTTDTCPYIYKDGVKHMLGTAPTFGAVSWDDPTFWSIYNVFTVATKKGIDYFENELAPRIYNKYKDLEVEIDDDYNIINWIGHINR